MALEFKSRKQIVNERCVEVCEEILQRAKSGDFESVFAVAFHHGGDYTIMISESLDALKKVGALERLKLDFLAGCE